MWEHRYRVIYPNIEKWINQHVDGNWSEFARKVGADQKTMSNWLTGISEPRKPIIDEILRVTGMTYEEAFHETY